MIRPVVFLVHGFGVHPEGWEGPVIRALDAAILEHDYAYFDGSAIEDHIEFIPLGYDDLLHGRIEAWSECLRDLHNLAGESSELADVLAWFDEKGLGAPEAGDENFRWTHAMDVAIYRFHPHVRRLILTRLIEAMAHKIGEVLDHRVLRPISILSHGLGTAVSHDAVHLLGTRPWGDAPLPMGPAHWRFDCIASLSNVSRLLESDIAQEASIVRPGPNGDRNSYCRLFLNWRHELDPFPWPRPFNMQTFPIDRMIDVRVRHVHATNVHSWEHYLKHPLVHIPLLRCIANNNEIVSIEEARAAVAGFPQWGGPFGEMIDGLAELRARFENRMRAVIGKLGIAPPARSILEGIAETQEVFDDFAERLRRAGGGQ